jgi:GGDEF domain-containing protein
VNYPVHFGMLKFRFIQSWLPTGGVSIRTLHKHAAGQHAQRLMPRKFEGLEAATLLFCGIYGLLVAMLLLKAALGPVLLSLALLAAGAWRLRYPVRSKLQWSIDALVVVLITAALFADSRTGGGSGPYLFLVLLFAMTFPLLMEASSAVLFTGLLLAVYFVFGRSTAWVVQSELFVLRGVLIAGLCLLSMQFGQVLRRSEETVEQLRHDLESGAFNEHGLRRYGQPLLRHCRGAGKPFCMVYLNMPLDWTQQIIEARHFVNPHPIEMRQLRAQAFSEMLHTLSAHLSADCLVGRDAQGDWVILMPGQTSQQAILALESAFGRPIQINFGPRADEMFVSMMPCVVEAQEGEGLLHLHARATDILNRGVMSGAV